MATTITTGAQSFTPDLVLTSSTVAHEATAIVHTIIGRDDPDITYGPRGLRRGALELFFTSAEAGEAAVQTLLTRGAFALTSDERPSQDMSFVVVDEITRTETPTAGGVRLEVRVPFMEVLA